jgi:hypothetical protein
MDTFPITDTSRPGEGTGHVQVAAGGNHGLSHLLFWPRHNVIAVRVLDPHHQPRVYTGWRDQRRNFNFLSKLVYLLQIGILVFQYVTSAKRQQDSPLFGFCYGFNKAFGFFFFMIISAPSLKLTLDGLIQSTFSMLTNIVR